MQREAVQIICVARLTRTPDRVFNISECRDPNPTSHISARHVVGDQVQLHLEETHLHLQLDANQGALGVLLANHVGRLPVDSRCVVEEEAAHLHEGGI